MEGKLSPRGLDCSLVSYSSLPFVFSLALLSDEYTAELPMRPTHALVGQETLPICDLCWQPALVLI